MKKQRVFSELEKQVLLLLLESSRAKLPMNSKRLAEKTREHQLKIVQIIEKLKSEGLLISILLPDDSTVLSLSEEGKQTAQTFRPGKFRNLSSHLRSIITTGAILTFFGLLLAVIQTLPIYCDYLQVLCPSTGSISIFPTPTSGVPVAQDNEILILVAQFHGSETIDVTSRITDKLTIAANSTNLSNVRVAKVPYIIENSTTAQEVGASHNATIVIWGWYDEIGSTANFETIGDHDNIQIARRERRESSGVSVQEAASQPSSKSAIYFRQGLPEEMTYFVSFAIGQLYYWDEDFEEALAAFSTAIENAAGKEKLSGLETVYFYRGYIFGTIREQSTQAISDYESAIGLKPDFVEAYNNLGNEYSDLEEYGTALEKFNKALEIDPEFTSAYNNRGNVYRSLEKYELAITDYNKAISLSPDDADAYANRGLTFYHLKNYRLAVKDYDRAISLDPKQAGEYNNRAIAYIELEELDKALEDLNQAIKLDPELAIAYNNRGSLYDRTGQKNEAIIDFNKAIELNQELAIAYGNRALVSLKLSKFEQAIVDYTKALELDNNNVEYYIGRGSANLSLEHYNAAKEDYNAALVIEDENLEALFGLGKAYQSLNNNDKALEYYSRAIKKEPNNSLSADAYNNRGNIWSSRGQLEAAIEDYTKAIGINSRMDVAYFNRGLAFRALGDREKAIADFQKCIELTENEGRREEAISIVKELE